MIKELRFGRWLMYATLFVPIVLFPKFFFPFVSVRGIYFRFVIELGLALFIALLITRKYDKSTDRDPILLALLAFVAANALAAAFGLNRWRSFFGDFERMWGVWTWLHLLSYYILLRLFMDAKAWKVFLRVSLVVCVITCIYGIIQYYQNVFGIHWEGAAHAPVYATLGNPGLYAAYLLFNIGFALYMWFEDRASRWRWAYLPFAALFTFMLSLAANRSTLLGVMLGGFVGVVCYSIFKARRKWLPPLLVCIAAVAVLVPVLIARANPKSDFTQSLPLAVQRLSQVSASGGDAIRLYQWSAAAHGFKARPILGYGPENYHLVWSSHFDPRSYRFGREERWDRAHNAFLEIMCTSGIVGMLAFLGLAMAFGYMLIKAYRAGTISTGGLSVLAGLFVAYLFYLFFWFFDLNATMLFIVLGALIASHVYPQPLVRFGEKNQLLPKHYVQLGVGALLLLAVVYIHDYSSLRVSNKLFRVVRPVKDPVTRERDFEYIFRSPSPLRGSAVYLYSNFIASINTDIDAYHDDIANRKFMDRIFGIAMQQFNIERARDTLNERIYIQEGRVALKAAMYYKKPEFFSAAVGLIRHSAELNPKRINTYHILANIYEANRDYESAYNALRTAYYIYPSYGETHYQFAQIEHRRGNAVEAARWLLSSITLKYAPPPDVALKIGRDVAAKDKALEQRIFQEYIQLKYPDFEATRVIDVRGQLPPWLAEMMPVAWPELQLTPR